MTLDGLKAISVLSSQGVRTNCTLVFSANQALLAARAGAYLVSPFVGRLDDIGHDGMQVGAAAVGHSQPSHTGHQGPLKPTQAGQQRAGGCAPSSCKRVL